MFLKVNLEVCRQVAKAAVSGTFRRFEYTCEYSNLPSFWKNVGMTPLTTPSSFPKNGPSPLNTTSTHVNGFKFSLFAGGSPIKQVISDSLLNEKRQFFYTIS